MPESPPGNGSLADLSEDLDTIYHQYTKTLPNVHLSPRLSRMDSSQPQLAPNLPPLLLLLMEGLGMALRPPMHPQANTNSSLNVLVDTPNPSTADLIGGGRGASDGDEWQAKGAAVRQVSEGSRVKIIKRDVGDFKFLKNIGEGLYSTVMLAVDKHTSKQYAIKVLDKRHIIKEKKVKYLNIEKHALNRLSNRMGIISLYFTFQDKNSLYFVLDFAANGELLSLIKKHGTLSEDCTRHYSAQILNAIKYMHDNGVIHRDIKPENILLDDKMRIQITDFGTARLLEKKDDDSEEYPLDVRAKLFVGTAEYVLPELLESKYCGKPGDVWAFGCILYQMIAGKPPFKATNEYLTFQKVTKLQYAFTAGFPVILRDLIKHILVLLPQKRWTIDQIMGHYFYLPTNWDDDAIWDSEPPELAPFKMLAKLMLKLPPELGKDKAYSPPVITTKKVYPQHKKRAQSLPVVTNNLSSSLDKPDPLSPAPGATSGSTSGSTHGSSPAAAGLGAPAPLTATPAKPVNPAKAAAYVLSKNTSDEKPTRSPQSRPRQEYIPGTNILRPQINSRTSFPMRNRNKQPPTLALAMSSLAQLQMTSPTPNVKASSATSLANVAATGATASPRAAPVAARKPSTALVSTVSTVGLGLTTVPSRTNNLIEVTPLSAVESAWQKYLEHPDERILRLGPAIVHKEATEFFERKHKGQIHNPISLSNKLDQVNRSATSKSLLSKVVNGLSNGLRGTDVMDNTLFHSTEGEGDESVAIINRINEDDDGDGDDAPDKKQKKLVFKKFLHSATQNTDEVLGAGSSPSTLLDRPRTCTVLCTTHGRVLVFSRNENDNYKIIVELKLNHSFMRIKEVAPLPLKFKLLIPAVGTFAVMLNVTTFVFEVDKYEVQLWTEALALAKLNQYERNRLGLTLETVAEPESEPTAVKEVNITPVPKQGLTFDGLQSPQLVKLPKLPPPASPTLASLGDKPGRLLGLLPVRVRRLIKRKPPASAKLPTPPEVTSPVAPLSPIDMSTGFVSATGEAEYLHAAQLAAASQAGRDSTEYPHRLSFSKENGVSRQGSLKGQVTQMNSKLLARSQRHRH